MMGKEEMIALMGSQVCDEPSPVFLEREHEPKARPIQGKRRRVKTRGSSVCDELHARIFPSRGEQEI